MGRKAVANWHVWCWDGSEFDLVYCDITRTEADDIIRYNNERLERTGSGKRYVRVRDGEAPSLEGM